jgi:hypothetical protein
MTLRDFFSLVTAGSVFVFAALTILAIVSMPVAIAIILWRVVFA